MAPDGSKIEYALRFAFTITNNEAEYETLANGLTLANSLGVEHIHIQTKERLVGYLRRVWKLAKLLRSCHMEHVPKERSHEADKLSQLATAGYETFP
ncbi:hypothetical protein LIER_14995 [Lithospermum erythrorhizon]|uniref:RNase H type-1 domain-containing protein n=1 Tax=Lithospermum erythrorhizon TaxID=34254 RepID=A0AAV3Q1K6_LITER